MLLHNPTKRFVGEMSAADLSFVFSLPQPIRIGELSVRVYTRVSHVMLVNNG